MPLRFVLLALLMTSAAVAQPLPPLVSGRPGFTASAVVVPLGHVQLEAGITRQSFSSGDVTSGPEALLRWTPLRTVELRFGAPDYIDADGFTGWGDPSLGVKVQLGPVADWDLGVVATASLPLGDDAFSSGSLDPELIVTAAHAFGARTSLGGQISLGRDGGADAWVWGSTYVLGLALNERWGLFEEIVITAPDGGPAGVLHHSGVTYALGANAQLDVHIGIGLTDGAPDTLLGLGFVVRR